MVGIGHEMGGGPGLEGERVWGADYGKRFMKLEDE